MQITKDRLKLPAAASNVAEVTLEDDMPSETAQHYLSMSDESDSVQVGLVSDTHAVYDQVTCLLRCCPVYRALQS